MKFFSLVFALVLSLVVAQYDLDLESILNQKFDLADFTVQSIGTPSAEPTAEPSAEPTVEPTVLPTYEPTVLPTYEPTATPSVDPSTMPTASPSFVPTSAPTRAPTAPIPTMTPTAVPTMAPTNLNLVSFVAQTILNNVSPEQYQANKVGFNITFQAALSASMEGTKPSDIYDISVTPTNQQAIIVSGRNLATSLSLLKYTVKTHLDGATYESLTQQLLNATTSGMLDNHLHYFAAVYNVSELANGTVFATVTSNLLVPREASSQLTGAQIAGLVIGIILCLGLLATTVFFFLANYKPSSAENTPQEQSAASGDASADVEAQTPVNQI